MSDDCAICGGTGEVDAFTERSSARVTDRETIGCPLCIQRDKDAALFAASWQRMVLLSAMADCGGGEQPAFEAWARSEHYDMQEHPLHWLFLNEKTYAARQGWKAALAYMRKTQDAAGSKHAQPGEDE